MTLKQKSEELFNSFFSNIESFYSETEARDVYGISIQQAKQCALIAVENEYRSRRELLFDLRSSRAIEHESVYLKRLDDTFDEEKQVKQELLQL